MLTAHFHNLSRFRSPATVDEDVGSPGQWNDSGDAIPRVNLDDVSFFLFKVEVRPHVLTRMQITGMLRPADFPCAPHLMCPYGFNVQGEPGSYRVTGGAATLKATLTDEESLAQFRAIQLAEVVKHLREEINAVMAELTDLGVSTQNVEAKAESETKAAE